MICSIEENRVELVKTFQFVHESKDELPLPSSTEVYADCRYETIVPAEIKDRLERCREKIGITSGMSACHGHDELPGADCIFPPFLQERDADIAAIWFHGSQTVDQKECVETETHEWDAFRIDPVDGLAEAGSIDTKNLTDGSIIQSLKVGYHRSAYRGMLNVEANPPLKDGKSEFYDDAHRGYQRHIQGVYTTLATLSRDKLREPGLPLLQARIPHCSPRTGK